MKKSFLVLYLLFATISFSSAQDWQWAKGFGGSNDPNSSGTIDFYNNQPHNIVLDDQGNSYLFGTYGGGTQINGEGLPSFTDYNCGTFVAKFDCSGNIVWHKPIARSGQHSCLAQYMILRGNRLYIQGTVHIDQYYNTFFLDTTVYGSELYHYYTTCPDSLTFPWIPFSDYTYIMELDLDGNIIDYNLLQLNNRFRSNIFDYLNRKVPFTIDNNGNYYLLMKHGYNGIENTEYFVLKHNDIAITDTITSNTKYGYYILKFDSDFNFQYIKPITECVHNPYYGMEMRFYDMECDSENNIYIAGCIQVLDTTSNPTYPYDVELADNKHVYLQTNNDNAIILKFNNNGDILWVNQTRDYGIDTGQSDFQSMLLDEASGNIYVSGYAMAVSSLFPGNYTIFGDNDTLVNNYNGEHSDLKNLTFVVACYDTNGNYKWYSCPNTLSCEIGGLATHNNKLYAATKWAPYGITCGENTYHPSMQIQGGGTLVNGYSICEWDLQGNMTDVRQIYCKAQLQTMPYDTRINSLGEIYTVGRFDNKMAFGEDTIIDQWGSDMFIAKFGLPCPTYIYDTATYCYGEVVQGVTLTASGDYTFTYPEGSQEFDSIVLVHATVLPPLTIGLSDTTVCTAQQFYLDACGDFDSYQWSTGGTGCTEMLQFDNACTQSVSLTVTRGECSATRTISITAQVCDGITEPVTTAMSLYPNPASDMVTIFGDGFVSATVIDISGRTLLRTTAMQLDISGLRPGEYVVKVERINGETEELKMVKE
jgi:hypothetical protein